MKCPPWGSQGQGGVGGLQGCGQQLTGHLRQAGRPLEAGQGRSVPEATWWASLLLGRWSPRGWSRIGCPGCLKPVDSWACTRQGGGSAGGGQGTSPVGSLEQVLASQPGGGKPLCKQTMAPLTPCDRLFQQKLLRPVLMAGRLAWEENKSKGERRQRLAPLTPPGNLPCVDLKYLPGGGLRAGARGHAGLRGACRTGLRLHPAGRSPARLGRAERLEAARPPLWDPRAPPLALSSPDGQIPL